MTDQLRLDLHVHSRFSPDSRLTLREIVGRLAYTGLRGFALTDHNSVDGIPELDRLARENPAYLLVPGVEVSAREGHLLAYGLRELPPVHRPIHETIDWVVGHGGVPVPAHPFRIGHGVGGKVAAEVKAPALEVRNGHTSGIANAKAELLAARRGLGGTGGSDVHTIDDLGRSFTEFSTEVENVDDVVDSILHGRSSGAGDSPRWARRLRLGARTALLRAGRGFRPI